MQFEVYKSHNEEYHWRLVSSNGQVLNSSPAFKSKTDCLSAINEYKQSDHIPRNINATYESCFISYSTIDTEFVEYLYKHLNDSDVKTWFAPKDLKYGAKMRNSIDEAILARKRVIVVLSCHSTQSQWVEKEIETALEQERIESRLVLVPIRIDDSVMSKQIGWPADLRRSRNIGDFTDWKDPLSFTKAFDDLLSALEPD